MSAEREIIQLLLPYSTSHTTSDTTSIKIKTIDEIIAEGQIKLKQWHHNNDKTSISNNNNNNNNNNTISYNNANNTSNNTTTTSINNNSTNNNNNNNNTITSTAIQEMFKALKPAATDALKLRADVLKGLGR
jgi:hypothetical protein